jgi:hypothetical protein
LGDATGWSLWLAAVTHTDRLLWLLSRWCCRLLLCCLLLLPTARPDYMTTFVDKLIDWDNVAKRFAAATS